MKYNKHWYKKVGIWIGIVAGVCAILGISIFGEKSLIKTNETDSATENYEDNKINIGDQSTVVFGDNNTINYGVTNVDTTIENNLFKSEINDFAVVASYDMNTAQNSLRGINVLVNAETTFPADRVTISAISDNNTPSTEMDMHGGLYNWQFVANFFEKGTYTVTVTAYNSEGESVSNEFIYIY